MEKLEFAKALGEKIIISQHDYFATSKSEDLEHITNLKRIIVATAEYLKSATDYKDKVNDLVEHLRQFSKTLYLNECIKNKDDNEDEGKIREESETWFDYIFENEKYPR
jgi:3-dehydroquinate dehydratase